MFSCNNSHEGQDILILLASSLEGDQYRGDMVTYSLNIPMLRSWVIIEPSTSPKNFPVCNQGEK